jgi:dTDP-4-dehydrorhamnose reductase
MKILVIGAAGFLGKYLVRDFSKANTVFGADKYTDKEDLHYLDLTEKEGVSEVFKRFKPELVLLPASVTGVDFCEKNQDLAWAVNVEGAKEVAVESKRHGAFLVFYSSDYIFDGAQGPYSEEDRPCPLNFYGKTKLEAENIIQKELNTCLIIRTCGLYGYEKKGLNYAMQVYSALAEGNTVKAVSDQFGTPTYVEDLSGATLKLAVSKKRGVFHVAGPDYLNRVQFAGQVADVFGFNRGLIKDVKTDELKQAAPRPKKGGLKADKLRLEAGIKTMTLEEGLAAMKEEIRKDKEK